MLGHRWRKSLKSEYGFAFDDTITNHGQLHGDDLSRIGFWAVRASASVLYMLGVDDFSVITPNYEPQILMFTVPG